MPFRCTSCEALSPKWSGKCLACEQWGTLEEQSNSTSNPEEKLKQITPAKTETLSKAGIRAEARFPTGLPEVDRVLSGGLVGGQVVLLSGEPGIGKSTLLAGLCGHMAKQGAILYVAGEESPTQLAERFTRLGAMNNQVLVTSDTRSEAIASLLLQQKPKVAIVDSVQTLTSELIEASAGGPTLLRSASAMLVQAAKASQVPLILVGQVTKDGSIAGPKLLEHLVDTVLQFSGDPRHAFRLLRVSKNRFGSTDEVGVFEMTSKGLAGVLSPALPLAEGPRPEGSSVCCTLEGSRTFILEIQALVNTSHFPQPIRRTSGFSANRLQMLLAVLERHTNTSFGTYDVYVNVAGGMQVRDPGADLAVCAALLSSRKHASIPPKTIHVGEVGLSGEVRPVSQMDRRKKDAERLGFGAFVTVKRLSELL